MVTATPQTAQVLEPETQKIVDAVDGDGAALARLAALRGAPEYVAVMRLIGWDLPAVPGPRTPG